MKRVVLHPLLFAAFPVAFLYERNAQMVPVGEAVKAAALIVGAAAVLLALLTAVFRSARQAGVAASGVALLLLSYGRVYEAAQDKVLWGIEVGRDEVLLAVWALAGVGVVAWAAAIDRRRWELTAVLNITAAALLAFTVAPIVAEELSKVPPYEVDHESIQAAGAASDDGELRDIYYIVPDRYTSAQVLRDYFQFDNTPFLDYLRSKGMFVAERSLTNYGKTSHALAASLNLRYLDDLTEAYPDEQEDIRPAYRMWEDNAVVPFLREQGYRFVYITSTWDSTAVAETADVAYRYDPESEFSRHLYETTIIRPLARRWGAFENLHPRVSHRRNVLHQFKSFPEAAALPGPKFVFMHLLVPHDPYVFEADGGLVTEDEENERTLQENFANHVRYTNSKLREMIDLLLDGPEVERPIVLLQADEGPHPTWRNLQRGKDAHPAPHEEYTIDNATDRELLEKFGILAAFYLPGDGEPQPYPEITPVNTFRMVFDRYFGTELGFVPDRNYRFDNGWVYRFIDVTDRLRAKQREYP